MAEGPGEAEGRGSAGVPCNEIIKQHSSVFALVQQTNQHHHNTSVIGRPSACWLRATWLPFHNVKNWVKAGRAESLALAGCLSWNG